MELMSLKEYQKNTGLTAVYPNIGDNPFYPTMLLVSETAEFIEAFYSYSHYEFSLELGDAFWCLSQVCNEFGLNLAGLRKENTQIGERQLPSNLNLFISLGQLTGAVSRLMRGDKDKDAQVRKATVALAAYIPELYRYVEFSDKTLSEILEMNLEKLQQRQINGTLKGSGDYR